MLRFDCNVGQRADVPDVDAFLEEIIQVCQRHDMALEHEDRHGDFIVSRRGFSGSAAAWLRGAMVAKDNPRVLKGAALRDQILRDAGVVTYDTSPGFLGDSWWGRSEKVT